MIKYMVFAQATRIIFKIRDPAKQPEEDTKVKEPILCDLDIEEQLSN